MRRTPPGDTADLETRQDPAGPAAGPAAGDGPAGDGPTGTGPDRRIDRSVAER